MIFNRIIKLSFLILPSFLLLSSCSDFLQGKPKKEMTLEVKKESMNCLKDVPGELDKFMKSESTDSGMSQSFDCLDKTLKEFETKAEGGVDPNSFNVDELHQILEKFAKEANISKEATEDLMLLKAAILGGSSDKITKEEIAILRAHLSLLKDEMKNLLPFAKLYTFQKSDIVFSKNTIRNGFAQLNLSLKNLLNITKISQSNYQFSDLKNLLLNLKIIGIENKGLLDLAEKINDLIVGHQDISTDSDRSIYIDNLTEALRLYATQVNGYVKFGIHDADQLNGAFEYIHGVVNLLENTIQFRKTKLISSETIDPLITEIIKKDILPVKLSLDTALFFYKTILVRVFESGLTGDINAFTGVKKVHFVNFKRELAVYRIYALLIETVMHDVKQGRLPIKIVQSKLQNIDIKKYQDILGEFDSEMRTQIIEIITEIRSEFMVKNPVVYRFNKIVLTSNQEVWDQNWLDLSRGLYNTMIARQLILGWGETPLVKELKYAHIGDQGMVQWYSEFKKFGIEVKIFDPRVKNSGKTNLLSANLFTRSGNGDEKISFREAVEFIPILFSGGGTVSLQTAAGFKKANCNLPELDVFGNNWNNEACVFDDLRKNYKYYFSNLSYLVAYLDRINQNEAAFKNFYDSIMRVARYDVSATGRLETADLRNMVTMLHYLESLFATYDLDRNWFLSESEIKASYPKFKTFAEQYAHKTATDKLNTFNSWWKGWLVGNTCFKEQDLIRESFVFLVYNGKTPGVTDLTMVPCLRNEPMIKFEGEVDRQKIINTLKIIKDVLGS